MTVQTNTVPADIAVVGMACRLPGASDPQQYWRNLREGVESIRFFDKAELIGRGIPEKLLSSPRYVPAAAVIDDGEGFDATFFGYSAREAEVMDPQHRHFLEVAYASLEDAGYDPGRYDGLIGVYAGCTTNTYLPINIVQNRVIVDIVGDLQIMIGNDKEYLPTRVSYKLDLRGPSMAVQTACSSSLTAIHVAAQAILAGECDMALAGGSSLRVPYAAGYLHQPGGTASPDGHCRAFDADSGGSVVGSGAGVVVLKHLADAVRDGDHIYAVIKGTSINNDGGSKASFTAPSVDGQAHAVASAILAADLTADDIGFVEAHGTATPLGDPIEVTALTRAFSDSSDRRQFCALGSVKTNIGHLDAAAGIAGFIKAVQALRHRMIPPTLHFRSPNPQLRLEQTPFYVNNELLEWESETPRRAAVNSLGMGGTNAHVIVEEAPPTTPGDPADPGQLLLLSAATPSALEKSTENLARWLREHPGSNLADVAYTLQTGRRPLRYRRAVAVRDIEDAGYALETSGSSRVVTRLCDPAANGVAFLFPGQGTQYAGMAARLYRSFPQFRTVFDECLSLIEPYTDEDFRALLVESGRSGEADERLRQTALTQPALFMVEYALAKMLESLGIRPVAMLGHSIGEFVAATLADVMSLPDALRVIVERGRLLSGLDEGAMLSVPLSPTEVERYLEQGVDVAAVNTPDLVTLSGRPEAIQRMRARLEADGVVTQQLHVSHAFHSEMVTPILDEFRRVLSTVKLSPPRRNFVSNVTGTWATDDDCVNPDYWVRHLRGTVRFAAGCETLAAEAGLVLLEVGPGKTLLTLARRCAGASWRELAHLIPGAGERGDAQRTFLQGLSMVWTAGLQLDWNRLWEGRDRRRVPLPTYPFEHVRYWLEPKPQQEDVPRGERHPARARDARAANARDWLYAPTWRQLPPIAGFPLAGRAFLVLDAEEPVMRRLSDALRAQGAKVSVEGTASVMDAAGWDAVLRRAAGVDTFLVHDGAGLDVIRRAGRFAALVRALRERRSGDPVDLVVIGQQGMDVSGLDPVDPGRAGMPVLAQTASQENPGIRCSVIDVDAVMEDSAPASAAMCSALAAATSGASPRPALALRNGRVWEQVFAKIDLEEQASPPGWGEGPHAVIGGLGHFGLRAAHEALNHGATHVTLIDKRVLPPEAEWPARAARENPDAAVFGTLLELRRLGSVDVVSCDATDVAALRRVLDGINASHGPLAGVFFAAGPPGDAGIAALHEATDEQLATHLDVRLGGLRALDEALADRPVGMCVVASSLASMLGGIGGSAYALAGVVSDAFVVNRNRVRPSGWLIVNWEHWRRPGERARGGRRDQLALDEQELRETLDLVVSLARAPQIAVSTADLDDRSRSAWRVTETETRPADAAEVTESLGHKRPELATLFVAPSTEIEQYIADTMAALLGIDKVGINDNFFELEADSLMAMQLVARLRDHYQVEMLISDLFEEPTVLGAAKAIESGRSTATAPGAAAAPIPGGDDIEAILAAAPPDELARLLAVIEETTTTE